jgi:hypothetical protein
MKRAMRVLASVAAASLFACSLLVETSDLIGGGGDDASSDRPFVPDAPATDASSDSLDAVADASVDADACVGSAARVCDNFDDMIPGAQWLKETTRGAIAFDAVGLSPPNAFRSEIVAGGGSGAAALRRNYANDGDGRCELDLKLESIPSSGELDVIDLVVRGGVGNDRHVYFASFDGDWSLAEYQERDGGNYDRSKSLGVPLPVGVWFHVVLEKKGTSAELVANGSVATLAALLDVPGTSRIVKIGFSYVGSSVPTAKILIDNVDCTFP